MKKIYQSAEKRLNSFSKKLIFILLFFMGVSGAISAQVSVTYTLPAAGTTPYTTLKAAFDAINAGTHQGVITISITGNTTEIATAVLNSSSLPSSYSSVTITPNAAGRVITGSLAGTAIVKLNGTDNVTIDGLVGGVRGLTFSNTNTSTSSGVIWVASRSSSDGASNNVIKDCIVTGSGATNTLVSIAQCSGTTLGGLAETANSNNSYIHNLVTNSQFGIGVVGASGNEDNNTQILSNTVTTLGRAAVFVSTQKNVVVSKNIISGVNSNLGTFTIQNSGILVVGSLTGGLIEKNDISNIQIASVWGCNGIQLDATNTNTGLVISNNFIYNIVAGGYTFFDSVDDNGTGIAVDAGGGYLIEYNSIDLSTNQPAGGITAAIWFSVGMGASTVTLKDNIFSNRETTSNRFAIYTNTTTNALFTSINYNDYYCPGGAVGFMSSARTSLANWQAVSGGDGASVSVDPIFISTSNLHVQTNSPLEALGTPIAGITTDIDGDVRNVTTPDIGADEFIPLPCAGSLGGTATGSVTSICASGSSVLSATGYSYGLGITYQWQQSATGLGGWSNVPGQTNPLSGNTGVISVTTYYQLLVTCSFTGTSGASTVVQVTVNNPAVSGASAVPRCGVGTTTAVATGTNLQWYTAATGGLPFTTGSPITTPTISATTTFYVSASSTGVNCPAGKAGTAGADLGYNGTDAGLVFDANQAFKLTSVKMYPQAAGTVTISAVTSAGALIASLPVTFAGATSTGVVVPLGFNIPIGTSHRLIISANSSALSIWRDFSGNTFPYPICTVGSITNGWISGTIATYYFFYDWQVSTSCESTRTPVVATVSAPPALTSLLPAAGPGRTICQGGCVTLDGQGGGYASYTWTPGTLPSPTLVCPTATTTYTLTSLNAPGGCNRQDIVTIIVNSTPSALTVSPSAASVCPSPTKTAITATGGVIPGQSIYTELAESASPFSFTLTNANPSLVSVAQNTVYFQQGAGSAWLTNQDNASGAIQTTANIPLTGFTNPSLTFYQIAGNEANGANHYDVGYVEYALTAAPIEPDWVKFPSSTYSGAGTLIGGVTGFDKTSYSDWNAQFTAPGSTPGVAPATALWKQETINLAAWQGAPNFRIRFHLVSDVSIQYYGWLIDNIRITGTGQAPITWSPVTSLFTDAACTAPYLAGTNFPNVWFSPPGPVAATTYTATATGGVSCTSTATTTLSASSLAASVTISTPTTTICSGSCVTFTATPVNGGAPPGYNWKKNGVSISGGSQVGLNVFTYCGALVSGDLITCDMSVNPNVGTCIAVSVVMSNTLTMTVNPTPTANPITGATGSTVCTGAPNLLTEAAIGTISTYQWYNSIGPVGVNSNTYSALIPETYHVIVSTAFGCKDTSANFVVTQPTYTITATAGPNGTISPIGAVVVNCGDNITFTITPNGGYSILDVVVDGSSVGPVGTYTFTNVSSVHTINATFFVVGCVTPATATAGANSSICSGSNYTISGASIGGAASSGTWSASNGNLGTFTPSPVFGTATSYTPSAADSANGSVDLTLLTDDPPGTCPASSSTITIIIKPSPYVVTGGQIGLCSTGATQTWLVADTSATQVNINAFQWYHPFPGSPVGTNNDSLQTASGATGSYTIVVTGVNGCTGSNTVAVNLLPTPTISISGTGPICTDAGVDINATAATASGTIAPNGYTWYLGASPISGATVSIYTATTAGSYQATATNSYGCVSAKSIPPLALAADNSPLVGLYTIGVGIASCTNYLSFARAIYDLNTRGISGNCIFSVPAGYTETVPLKGLKLGSALLNPETATGKTIIFSKSGAGANPLLTAYTGGLGSFASAQPDGIFCLRGVDNVSINQIDLTDNAANVTVNSQMEYGYGIFKFTTSDGAQNNTIQNCNITLNKTHAASGSAPNPDGSNGIVIMNAVDTIVLTAFVPASANGTNSNNKIYGNTISNVHNGITLIGYTAASPFTLGDTNNDVGGTVAGTGNTITNFGNSGDANAPSAIRLIDQWGVNASFNTIDNNNGSGSNTTNQLRGIWATGGTSANATYSTNTISLKSNSTGSSVSGIDNGIGATPAGNTISIFNNTISGSSLLATTGTWVGITNSATAATVSLVNNNIQNITLFGTGTFTGISNTLTTSNLLVSNNKISGNSKNGTGTMVLINTGGPIDATINNNNLINNVIIGGGFSCTMICIQGGTSNYSVDHNVIYNNSIIGLTGAAIGLIYGYTNTAAPLQETLTDNVVKKLFITGSSTGLQVIRGFNNVTSNTGTFRIVARNIIDSFYTSTGMSTAITGIFSGAGNNVSMSKNVITRLWPGQSATAGSFAKGISISSTGAGGVKVFNNSIAIDLTQGPNNSVLTNATGVTGIEMTNGTNSIYYNTIRLAGTGAAGFGSSGITQTAGTMDVRDNIVANYMNPGAGGVATALRRTGGTYALTSNNNLWYTLQDATHPIYYTGAGVNTLVLFQAAVTPREALSIGDNPVFVSTLNNDLHLDPANNCNLDGAGTPIAAYTDDYDSDVRDAILPDVGMDEFTGTGAGFVWKGKNTDWLNANNWCGGVPTAASDVTIPAGKAFYPIIITGTTALAHNININSLGTVTINSGGILANTGSWTNGGTLTNNGTIVLNGTLTQTFPGAGAGTLPAMSSLTVDNAAGAIINKPMTISGTLKPKTGNIAVNDVVTLHSDNSTTASVDTIQGSISYGAIGNFVVERFISTKVGAVVKTGWRYLSAPIGGTQTINAAWQNGEVAPAYTANGYGMVIVGPGTTAVGFDMNNTLSSLKKYDQPTNTWVTVPGTYGPISAPDGYMAFIRGDRGSILFGSSSATTLRETGPIKTGPITVSTAAANVNQFISVGNPYPSAISFASLSTSKTALQDIYYVWDPKLSTYGAYQSFSGPTYAPVPGGGSYAGPVHNFIESGMAFFVVSNGTVTPHSIQMT
ncbi:MAG: hypothetical protein ABI402_06650, partial [Ferruginibacter sp.]